MSTSGLTLSFISESEALQYFSTLTAEAVQMQESIDKLDEIVSSLMQNELKSKMIEIIDKAYEDKGYEPT